MPSYDVFLSHSSADKAATELIAHRLREEAGLNPFLDKWHLIPGRPWQEALEEALNQSATVAVFIGPSGISPWHNEQMRAALDNAVRTHDDYRVIPVLLPGANPEAVAGFLARRTWVDFRSGLDDTEAFKRLVAGIKGEAIVGGAYELPDEPVPYRGLLRFEAEHARFFFGREADCQRLVEKLEQHPFVALLGASGSGKSSLVRAGLLPALANDALPGSREWQVLVFTPGSHPLRALAEQLATLVPPADRLDLADKLAERLASRPDGMRTAVTTLLAEHPRPLLLVVDQFEELFMLCPDPPERCRVQVNQFVANLADAVQNSDGCIRVVLALRADILDRCLAFPLLRATLEEHQVLLGALSESALRDAIVRPAQAVGAFFEKGLVSAILRDVEAQPGALPLLQHALYELWRARQGPWLTADAYQVSGGVDGALQRRAQATYEALTPEQQRLARSIFLRLTSFGEGVSNTRRRASRSELYLTGADPVQVDRVLQTLSGPAARLIIADEMSVEVAHEALIQQWPTLRQWLEEDREGVRIHRRLTEAAQEWERRNHDRSYLYGGARLAVSEDWAQKHAGDLNPVETEFLSASISTRKRTRFIQGAAVLLIIGILSLFAVRQNQMAVRESNVAATARAESTRAIRAEGTAQSEATRAVSAEATARADTSIARSREIASIAVTQLQVDAERSLLLAIEALNKAYTVQAEEALRQSLADSRVKVKLPGNVGYQQDVAWSPDGTRLAFISADTSVRIWEVASLLPEKVLQTEAKHVTAIAWNANGDWLAGASQDGAVWLWSVRSGKIISTVMGYLDSVNDLAWSPNGQQVAAGGCMRLLASGIGCAESRIMVWNLWTGQAQTMIDNIGCEKSTFGCGIMVLAWSPEDEYLAAGLGDGTVRLWDPNTHVMVSSMKLDYSIVYSLAWRPGRKQLASLGADGIVRVWNATTGNIDKTEVAELALAGTHVSNEAVRVAWDPNGAWLAFNDQEHRIRLWNYDTGQTIVLNGHTDSIKSLAWSPDGKRLASASLDGSIRLWNMDVVDSSVIVLSKGWGYSVDSVAWNPTGTELAFDYYGVELWNLTTREWTTISGTNPSYHMALDPTGTRFAFGTADNVIRVRNVHDGKELLALKGHTDLILDLAWSPDGTQLASAAGDHKVKIWDIQSGRETKTLEFPASGEHGNSPGNVAWSPDGNLLAFSLQEPVIGVWNKREDKTMSMAVPRLQSVYDLAWSPDGTKIASASRDVIVWDTVTGDRLYSLVNPYAKVLEGAYSVAWSPDGSQLACGYSDGIIRLWDVATKSVQMSLTGHTGKVLSLAWSYDGRRLASGSDDFSARIYYTRIEDLLTLARQQISWEISPTGERKQRELQPEERYLYLGESQPTNVP